MLPSLVTLALLSQPYRTSISLACDGGIVCTKSGSTYTVIGTGGGVSDGGSSGGAPVDGEYVTYSANGTLTAERVLSAGNYTVVDNGTAGQSQIDWQHGLTCGAGNVLTTDGTSAMVCVNPVPDATAFVTGGIRLTGDLGGTATSPSVVDDSHAHTGTSISSLDTGDITSGTLGVGRGGTGVATVASNQVYVGTGTDTLTAKTLPSCSNATTSKLLYDNATQTFSCGTDQTGGGSSGPVRRVLTTGYTGTGTGTTAVAMPLFTWDAGAVGWNAIIDCELMTITDGGTGNGIRFNVSNASATATEVRRHFQYCSSATAIATINNGTGFGTHAPTASQGGVPCRNRLHVSIRNVTAIGQVQFYMYSELASPNQVTVLPGSYCDYSGW